METVYDGKYLRLIKENNWEYAQRKNLTGIVGIIAITNDKKLILVEQYRIPVHKLVIEIPAGLAGDSPDSKNEPLEQAAIRELEEETGYRAVRMTNLATGVSSAGLADETITLFFAHDIKKVHAGHQDPAEKIHVHEIPLSEVEQWLKDQTNNHNKLLDLKIFSALHFARKFGVNFSR